MLISLRGTNGSGKSTVVRNLFQECGHRPIPIYGVLGPKLPEAYQLVYKGLKNLFVLGPYTTGTGGCDRIQPYDLIPELIGKYASRGHVLFEGIIVTSVYGQVGQLMEGWKKDSVFIFLDTPLEECLRRIESRRGGKVRDDRLIKNVSSKYKTALRIKDKIETEGKMRVETASSDTAHKKILQLLKEKK